MDDLTLVLTIAGAVVGFCGAAWIVVQLVTAGRGSFLKERNEELASAYEQVQKQRDNERADCQRQIGELRDQVNQLRGEVAAHRIQYAQVIASAVIKALAESGYGKGRS